MLNWPSSMTKSSRPWVSALSPITETSMIDMK
jgi:hypothetical protein